MKVVNEESNNEVEDLPTLPHGLECCGEEMVLSENELVYECLVCEHWQYTSS